MKKGSREYVDSRAKTTQVNLHFDNFELSDFFLLPEFMVFGVFC